MDEQEVEVVTVAWDNDVGIRGGRIADALNALEYNAQLNIILETPQNSENITLTVEKREYTNDRDLFDAGWSWYGNAGSGNDYVSVALWTANNLNRNRYISFAYGRWVHANLNP